MSLIFYLVSKDDYEVYISCLLHQRLLYCVQSTSDLVSEPHKGIFLNLPLTFFPSRLCTANNGSVFVKQSLVYKFDLERDNLF